MLTESKSSRPPCPYCGSCQISNLGSTAYGSATRTSQKTQR